MLQADVSLTNGDATLVLEKEGVPHVSGQGPEIDCVLLTTDHEYRPDYRDFNQQIYVRVRVERSSMPKAPFGMRVTTGRQEHGPFVEPLAEGDVSAWLNATRWFNGVDEARWNLIAGRPPAALEYTIQFATAPDPTHVVRDIRVNRPGRVVLLLPAELSKNAVPRADFELAEERARDVTNWPPVSFGRRPTRFPVLTNLDAEIPGPPAEKRVLASIGLNGFTGILTDADVAQGFLFSRVYNSAYYFPVPWRWHLATSGSLPNAAGWRGRGHASSSMVQRLRTGPLPYANSSSETR